MAKYSQEFKLKVVQYYLSGFGKRQTSAKFKVPPTDVRKWVLSYQQHGIEGLVVKTTKTLFTTEFKHQVVQAVLHEGLSLFEAAQRFNIGNKGTIIIGWLRQYNANGIDGLKPKPRGRPKGMPQPSKAESTKADQDKSSAELLEELNYLRARMPF